MSANKISRRDFIKISCLSTAALGLTICGVTAMAPDPPPIDLSSFTFGEKRMDNRILIAYATFASSTKEVAVDMGKTLGGRGFSVDVIPVLENPKVSDYQFVLIGSAVYQSRWRSEAIEFVKTNQIALNQVSVAFFSVCLSGLADDEAKRSIIYGTVRPIVKPVAEVLFAGRVNRRGVSLFLPDRLARFFPTIDFRDWSKMRSWAQSVFVS
jgi:menaquinone-dependent protoporphyrinogen oxidase